MTKVLHFGAKTYPPSHGGVEKIVFDLFSRCKDVDAYVVADVVSTESPHVYTRAKGFYSTLLQLIRLKKDLDIDVIHFHKETSILYGVVAVLLGYKSILTLHGFGWRVPRWSFFSRALLWALDVIAYFTFTRVVFCSSNDYAFVRRVLQRKNLVCIENGVEVCKGRPSAVSTSSGGIYIGRVSPEKNVLALRGINKKCRFDVFGPIDERDGVFALKVRDAARTGDLTYCGPVNSESVPALLGDYNFLINLSFSEGMPVAVLEGAAQGLFLILSDIPAHRALGFPDCIYVDPSQPNLDAIDFSALRKSESNRMRVISRFSLDSMADRYSILYREVSNG